MAAHKGIPLKEEHKKKISEAHMGKIVSDETKEKMSIAHKGKPKSEEHKQALKEAAKKRGAPNFVWTPELKAKASKTRKETWMKKREEKDQSNK